MPDCTGYQGGYTESFTLCVDGPVGNGATANLSIISAGPFGGPMIPAIYPEGLLVASVPNWDGSDVSANGDLSLIAAGPRFAGSQCDVSSLVFTVSPDPGSTSGTLSIAITIDNCVEPALTSCGGPGPHVVTAMSSFSLDGPGCS